MKKWVADSFLFKLQRTGSKLGTQAAAQVGASRISKLLLFSKAALVPGLFLNGQQAVELLVAPAP